MTFCAAAVPAAALDDGLRGRSTALLEGGNGLSDQDGVFGGSGGGGGHCKIEL